MLLTAKQWALKRGVSVSRLWQWIDQGRVKAEKMLGQWLIESTVKRPAPQKRGPKGKL